MQTFIVSIYKTGYDRDFNGQPSLTKATGGVFYNIGDVINGKTDMKDIFQNIAGHLNVTYTLQYIVNDIPGLDPTLKLNERNIQISVDPSLQATIKLKKIQSSFDGGQNPLNKDFQISMKDIHGPSLKVMVNGHGVSNGFTVHDRLISFNSSPVSGALIEASYLFATLKDNMNYAPLVIKANRDINPDELTLIANSFVLSKSQYRVTVISANSVTIDLDNSLFAASTDPVEIIKRGGLSLEYSFK